MNVGDAVWVMDVNFPARRSVITKVGKKYAYVEGHRTGFDLLTRRVNDAYGHAYLLTETEYEAKQVQAEALAALNSFNVNVAPHHPQLIAIYDALKPLIANQGG